MPKGKLKTDVLSRTEKWELVVTSEQEQLLMKISDGLREYYNWALEQWQAAYAAWRAEKKSGTEKPLTRIPTFFDQVNLLTGVGVQDRAASLWRANILRNWKEETLDSLHGALKSFFALAKKGDPDARPPQPRREQYFCAIPGRSGFSIRKDKLVLAPNIFGRDTLVFDIPQERQAMMLARASNFTKFIITRDEQNVSRPGRYWVSLSYEIPKPEEKPFVPQEAVFIAPGASSIGVISPKGEEVIELWRPDKHWKPKINAIETSLEAPVRGTNFHPLKKGSRKWRMLHGKRSEMFRIMAAQQTQNRREVVSRKLIEKAVDDIIRGHGVHFVVSDVVVRSKEGKLADASKPERGGSLGLNWAAQNIGSLGYLVQWLGIKAPEAGGTVRKHRFDPPPGLPQGHGNKILMARALKESFLASCS